MMHSTESQTEQAPQYIDVIGAATYAIEKPHFLHCVVIPLVLILVCSALWSATGNDDFRIIELALDTARTLVQWEMNAFLIWVSKIPWVLFSSWFPYFLCTGFLWELIHRWVKLGPNARPPHWFRDFGSIAITGLKMFLYIPVLLFLGSFLAGVIYFGSGALLTGADRIPALANEWSTSSAYYGIAGVIGIILMAMSTVQTVVVSRTKRLKDFLAVGKALHIVWDRRLYLVTTLLVIALFIFIGQVLPIVLLQFARGNVVVVLVIGLMSLLLGMILGGIGSLHLMYQGVGLNDALIRQYGFTLPEDDEETSYGDVSEIPAENA